MLRALVVSLLFIGIVHGQPLEGVRILTPETKTYEKAELALAPTGSSANPFDPHAIALDATVTMPSGKTMRVPGFWFQDYTRALKDAARKNDDRVEVLTPVGKPEWRVRFSSPEAGVHHVVLELTEGTSVRKSAPIDVTITKGPSRGMIRISPRNRTYLEDDAGKAFFPIGQNLCMYPGKEGTHYYDRILPKLAGGGGNYVRLWQEYMAPGDPKRYGGVGEGSNAGFPLESIVSGLGRYELPSAWRLDYVTEACAKHGVHYQICFEFTTWWNRKMVWRWPRNPYNAVNGGPCKEPIDYLTNETARDYAARRHRYSVARWGWSPNLAMWEMWNEVDNLDGFDSAANQSWHKELCGKLKAVDPWKHLVTTSWRDPKMFSLPEIDVVQAHSYWNAEYDAAEYSLEDSNHLMMPFGKPFFFGEQGMSPNLPKQNVFALDPEGKVHHASLWSSSLVGAAGPGMLWHWRDEMEPYDLYHHFGPLAKFVKDVDFPGRQWKQVKPTHPSLPPQIAVYGIAAKDRALVWIHDPLAFRIVGDKVLRGEPQKAASANVEGLGAGNYKIEWWDTNTGKVVGNDSQPLRPLRHFGYGIELRPPPFEGDIAAKILRNGEKW